MAVRFLTADPQLQDGLTIPAEIKRRQDRLAKLHKTKQAMAARAKERLIEQQAAYQEKLINRQAKENLSLDNIAENLNPTDSQERGWALNTGLRLSNS